MHENGVARYIRATVDIYFPEGEYLLDTRGTGAYCPLKILEEEGEY